MFKLQFDLIWAVSSFRQSSLTIVMPTIVPSVARRISTTYRLRTADIRLLVFRVVGLYILSWWYSIIAPSGPRIYAIPINMCSNHCTYCLYGIKQWLINKHKGDSCLTLHSAKDELLCHREHRRGLSCLIPWCISFHDEQYPMMLNMAFADERCIVKKFGHVSEFTMWNKIYKSGNQQNSIFFNGERPWIIARKLEQLHQNSTHNSVMRMYFQYVYSWSFTSMIY